MDDTQIKLYAEARVALPLSGLRLRSHRRHDDYALEVGIPGSQYDHLYTVVIRRHAARCPRARAAAIDRMVRHVKQREYEASIRSRAAAPKQAVYR